VVAPVFEACGGDGGGVTEPDSYRTTSFVGTWDAVSFTVASRADPDVWADLLGNGTFNINVQRSGTYTATLAFDGGIPLVEIGTLISLGACTPNAPACYYVVLSPNGGHATASGFTSTFFTPNTFVYYSLTGNHDRLLLIGPTEFVFNPDDGPEQADARIDLRLRN
jgi:hypothetical protein